MRAKFAGLLSLLGLLGTAGLFVGSADAQQAKQLGKLNFRRDSNGLQNVVTWDEYSLFIRGERVMIWGGEVHPFRQPSAGLWIDIFQKIKGLYEGQPGHISWDNFLNIQPFFDAAMEAGLYLIARPGPYINAETVGGGFPGWGTRLPDLWRSSNKTYVDSYQLYWKEMCELIAKNQITNGGSVILFQLENEYSGYLEPHTEDFEYERLLIEDTLKHGIVIPTTTNDVAPSGRFTSVDVYGHDSYPNGFDCTNPMVWAGDAVPEWFWGAHLEYSPDVPYAVYEMQGGAFDGWGGAGFDRCSLRLGSEFERIFYKNQLAMSVSIYSIYMTYGGTSWGGIAHPGGYTSYDYGSMIAEDRTLRPKYYEANLPHQPTSNIYATQGAFTGNQALKVTQTLDVVGKKTGFYTIRQVDISLDTTLTYKLTVPTSIGNVTIPALGGDLSLIGKDSKIHLVDYTAGSTQLVYSSAEIFTSLTVDKKDVIVLYGAKGELHETAIKTSATAKVVGGSGIIKQQTVSDGVLAIQYTISGQTIVDVGSTLLYLVDRDNAYQFWNVYVPGTGAYAHFSTKNPILIKGGYFVRGATVAGGVLSITGDLDGTSSLEIIAPATDSKVITFNGARLQTRKTAYGSIVASVAVNLPSLSLPTLSTVTWKVANSLPEISATYDDSKWVVANHTTTNNPTKPDTPVVLYANDYGFHTGNLLWRAHFTALGGETGFVANFIGSWEGDALTWVYKKTLEFSAPLNKGEAHVITILQDHMGYDQNWWAASEQFKAPRGIFEYSFVGNTETTVTTWKVTGNLGGESYIDKARGPLNEGGLYAERQGWHLPGFDDSKWKVGDPNRGFSSPGVSLYRTKFNLNVPSGLDYPISVQITNSTINPHYRAQIYVNGYQFGKYVNSIGPQKSFPIPEGILNYQGSNTLAVSVWALDAAGASITDIALKITKKVKSSKPRVKNMDLSGWKRRPGAY
ncbi:glycoside hydrolase family 35 protein [Auriculariales sp. MPI-PUGE-AT-0066]|nr:glycoside hydrolase family 35 protein [Auriculariales sp. MPI-PUGE-AT-0066]